MTPLRWLGRRENSKQAADQDNALIDTPEHSDVVEDDDDVLADDGGARPTGRFRRLQRSKSNEKIGGAAPDVVGAAADWRVRCRRGLSAARGLAHVRLPELG